MEHKDILILVPYTVKDAKQQKHLELEGYIPTYVYVGNHPHSYYEVLQAQWAIGRDFILLEHDVFPWPGALEQMSECNEVWCGHDYLYPPIIRQFLLGIGCMKFSSKLIEKVPDFFKYVDLLNFRGEDLRDWRMLDSWIISGLRDVAGVEPHLHTPPVVHLKSSALLK